MGFESDNSYFSYRREVLEALDFTSMKLYDQNLGAGNSGKNVKCLLFL